MSSRGAVGRAEHRAALDAAEALLAERHPLVRFKRRAGRGAFAEGPIELKRPDGTIDPVEVGIAFGTHFPAEAPVAYDAAKRWTPNDDRHIPDDHTFCLYLRHVDEPDIAQPDGLDFWLLDLVVFLHQQLVYESTGRACFPGPEWAHGRRAHAQHAIETLASFPADCRPAAWSAGSAGSIDRNGSCPCGSGKKTKRCHLDQLNELRRIARRSELATMTHRELEELHDG